MPVAFKLNYEGQILEILDEDLICPLTKSRLQDPVVASDGHTYSRAAIQHYIDKYNSEDKEVCLSPVSGKVLITKDTTFVDAKLLALRPNYAIKDVMEKDPNQVPEVSVDNFLCLSSYKLITFPKIYNDGKTYDSGSLKQYNDSEMKYERIPTLPYSRELLNTSYENLLVNKIIKRFSLKKLIYLGCKPESEELIRAIELSDLEYLATLERSDFTKPLNELGCFAAHIAAIASNIEVLNLLKQRGVDISLPSARQESPLHYAVSIANLVTTAAWLIDAGCSVDEKNESGLTPLMLAAKSGKKDSLQLLLSKGARLNEISLFDGKTALHCAALSSLELCNILLDADCDASITTEQGLHFLHVLPVAKDTSTYEDYMQILEKAKVSSILLEQSGKTILHGAVEADNINFAKAILDYCAKKQLDIINVGDAMGASPLISSIIKGSAAIATLLISYKANVNKTNKNGISPMTFAFMKSDKQCIMLLRSAGGIIYQVDRSGKTIFDHMVELKNVEMMNFLSNLEPLDATNSNFLHLLACSNFNLSSIQYREMLNEEADEGDRKNLKKWAAQPNAFHETPLHKAYMHRKAGFVEFLLSLLAFNDIPVDFKLASRKEHLENIRVQGRHWLMPDNLGKSLLYYAKCTFNLELQQYLADFAGINKRSFDDRVLDIPAKKNEKQHQLTRSKSCSVAVRTRCYVN